MSFLICYLISSVLIAACIWTGSPVLVSLGVAFFLVPVIDFLIGKQHVWHLYDNNPFHRAVLYGWLPFHAILLFFGTVATSSMQLSTAVSWAVPFGLIGGGIGITIAHELGHRYDSISQFCARSILTLVGYPHFTLEHNLGHHVSVATEKDPATARMNESFWLFLLRTLPGQYLHAWKIEARRLSKIGKPWFSLSNKMYLLAAWPLALAAIIWNVGGSSALGFFLAQAALAVFLLEAINYVEHYGLVRKVVDGKTERVREQHSWDANFWFTNHMLFRLQQHAEHHSDMRKKYESLSPSKNAPQMPLGYPGMILLALIPPLWRHVMNPRVRLVRGGL